MNDRRKNRKKRKVLFILYLTVCLIIIVSAYFQLSRIARNFNTQHLELITGLYAEKMNESMEYLQSYAQEDVKTIQAMDDKEPETILERLEDNLDQTVFTPVRGSTQIHTLYTSIKIENLRQLGVYELLQGKISVHLLKADSENFITCISSNSNDLSIAGSWNNLLFQQKYFQYDEGYSYNQWLKDMRSGKKEGRFSAEIKGEETTISYRSISSMPGWYVVVELTNKNISDITQHFSAWGGIYGSILVGFTLLYMFTVVLWEKKDKQHYMGLSAIDPLTELLNRRAFQTAVEEEISKKTSGYFIFIDVDNFKIYNDTYGHDNGDLCLKHFAKTMKQCFPEGSILGRYGGDEFVVYLKESSAEKVQIYI